MVAATLMDIDCIRLDSGASLLRSLELAAATPGCALAVTDASGRFVGSLTFGALINELAGAGWHCGNSSVFSSLEGTAGVGIVALVDRTCPRVGPEASAATVAKGLVSASSGGARGFVAVVDNSGVLLGTVTGAGFIAGLLEVNRAGQ